MPITPPILILGVGNDILADDGIGPKIVQDLQKELDPDRYDLQTSCVGGMEILEMICSYQQVILIDAIRTRNGVPGSVYLMEPDDFKETCHLSSFHDVNFLTALKMGRCLDFAIPEHIWIIAVEIVEDLVFSQELTPVLQEKYPAILREVRDFLATRTALKEL